LITSLLVLAVAATLAFANGANDNFKGVATLRGCGRLSYSGALALATATTLAGSLAAIVVASGLARRFSGKGLVPDAVVVDPVFVLAVAIGAALTVLLATRLGLPISTTHALAGALLGAGLVAAGPEHVSLSALGSTIAAPLLVSPVVALALAAVTHAGVKRLVARLEAAQPACLCTQSPVVAALAGPAGGLLRLTPAAPLHVDPVEECERHGSTRIASVDPRRALDGLHVMSAGAVGFARGLNDTPKIAGVLAATQVLAPGLGIAALAMAMAAGGLAAARRVARTLSFDITRMDEQEGLSANLVTAALVVIASPLGLPVSTTHVSCGALFGIGAANGEARWKTIGSIAGAWAVTLPAGAALSALAASLLYAIR
jgi:PiT family inorganic phosphate transporter